MYVLKVKSWENDADNYRTEEVRSEDHDHIELLVRVAHLFFSESDDPKGFGNSESVAYDADQCPVNDAIDKIIEDMKAAGKTIHEDWVRPEEFQDRTDFYSDHIHDLIGAWNEGEYYRVFESFKVEWIQNPVDVTGEFTL